jgi:hypothetical protein
MNSTLSLTGLIGSNPLGFLAALGCLRILGAKQPVLLSWDLTDEWRARLHFPHGAEESALRDYVIGELVSFASQRTLSSELTFADSIPKAKKGKKAEFACDIKILPEQYAQIVSSFVTAATPSNRELVDWFAAFGSELMTDKTSERKVKPTAFHMTAGQQKFLNRIQKLVEAMKGAAPQRKGWKSRSQEDRVGETLFGPWKYFDEQNALGWDPVTENVRALSAEKSDPDNVLSVQGAVYLGFHALPLFPTAVKDHRLMTTAFKDFDDYTAFTWPLWDEPLSLDSIRTALQLAELQQPSLDAELLRVRGVTAVMRSVRGDIGGKGLAILRNAVVVTG